MLTPAPPPSSPHPAGFWLPESQAFLEVLASLMLRCVGLVDPQGIIRFTNHLCRSIYGWEPQEIIGRHFRDLYAAPPDLDHLLAVARLQGRVDNWPILARDREGREVPVKITLVHTYSAASELLGSVAVIQDCRPTQDQVRLMQEQGLALLDLSRRLELANLELERAARLKNEFLANTTHELRTPLNGIMGFLRLVLDGLCDSPEEEREFIQNAYSSARNLLDLINELLDSARIEAGKMELTLVPVNIPQIFTEVEKLTYLQAAQKELRLTFHPARREVQVRADPAKFQQILLNLVANAIKFTSQGEVQVRARPFPSRGHVRFEVEDTGIGIPRDNQRELFQKFVQGDGSPTRQYGGAGLGLAICKNLVEFMGGQIWLHSPGQGQGTTACFTLPLFSGKTLYWRRTEDREGGFQVKGPKDGPLVLLVEDEAQIIQVMERILHRHGYSTVFAVTADDGLEGAKRLQPALITLDMGLPSRPRAMLRSGLDLYQALQRDRQTAAIPLLLVTGHEPALGQALQGIREIPPTLAKPFRARDLLAKVAGQIVTGTKCRNSETPGTPPALSPGRPEE